VERSENIPPVAVAGEPMYCYVNETLEFSSVNSYDEDGFIVGVHWDFGDGITSNEETITHTYSKRDMYEVTLTVTDEREGTHQDIVKCYVMEKPSVTIEGPYERNKGELITFNAIVNIDSFDEGNTVEEYEWSLVGDFAKTTNQNPTHRFDEEGEYPITVKVTDTYGEIYTASATFNIVPKGWKVTILGQTLELSIETLMDYSGWILGIVVALISILGASKGAIGEIIGFFSEGSKKKQFYNVLDKRMLDLEKTYSDNPEVLVSELQEFKTDLLGCLKDKSISMKQYTILDNKIDKIIEKNRKNENGS
jgi:chitodextrinase